MPSTNKGTMSSVPQPMWTSPRRRRAIMATGLSIDHQLDLELLAVGRLPDLSGLDAVVGQDDRRPAGPDVQGETDGVVLHRLVARGPLDFRQALGRLEAVFLDRGHRRGRSADSAFWPSCPPCRSDLPLLPQLRRSTCAFLPWPWAKTFGTVDGKRHQADHDDCQHDKERGFGLSCHGNLLFFVLFAQIDSLFGYSQSRPILGTPFSAAPLQSTASPA